MFWQVHKSQGMSLARLQVELGDAFAEGQCYVALSRAVTVDGLCIKSFDASRVKISFHAQRFHAAVSKASKEQDPKPLDEYWAQTPFWWREVVNGIKTHDAWPDVYRGYGRFDKEGEIHGGTSFGSEFSRWEEAYPVPEKYKYKRTTDDSA